MARRVAFNLLTILLALGRFISTNPICRADEPATVPPVAAVGNDEAQTQLAQERFLELLRQHPRPGTALDRVYAFHLERGTLEEFLTSLQHASENETNGVSAMIRGLVELQRGHNEQAVEMLTEADRRRPEDPHVAWSLGRALIQEGQVAQAAEAFERAIKRVPDRTDLLAIFQDLNRAYRRAQQNEKANEVWNRMEQLFPDDLRVKEQIANAMFEDGDFQAALPRFQELAKLTKNPYLETQSLVTAADIMLRLDQRDGAIKTFESQLDLLDPGSWLHRDIRQRIENVFVKNGDYVGLATYYESWLKTHPEDLDAMTRLGRSLAFQGRNEDARRWYKAALRRAPSNVTLREAMIEQLVREERYVEAIEHYEYLSKAGMATSDHIEEWGFLFLNRRDLAKLDRQSRAADIWLLLRDKKDDAVAVSQVASLMHGAGLSQRSIELYRQAINLAPDQSQYKIDLGDVYYALQRRVEALAAWNSIATGDERTPENLVRLSGVLRNYGFQDEALQAMRDVVSMAPEFRHRIQLAQMLREFASKGETALLKESMSQIEIAVKEAATMEEREIVLRQRIRGLEVLGQLQSAANALTQELATKQHATADDWRTLALYLDALNELPEATAAIEEAIKADGSFVAAWTTAAELFERSDRLNDACNALRRLTELDQRSQTKYLQKLAELEQREGRIPEAQQAAKQLLAAEPTNPDALRTYANLCFLIGEDDEALNTLRRAVRINASDHESLLALSRALVERNEMQEAIGLLWIAFDRSTALADRQGTVSTLTELHLQTNQFDQLVRTLDLRSRELSQRRDMLFCLAQMYRTAGDVVSCREVLERLVTADSRDVELLSQLSQLAVDALDLEAAAEYQRRINTVKPTYEGDVRLANLLMQLGDVAEADAIWMRIAETETDPLELLRTADRLAAAGNLDTARHVCQRLLKREPNNWEAMFRDGLYAWQQDQHDEALKSFDAILTLNRDWDELSAEASQKVLNSNSAGISDLSERRLDRLANTLHLHSLLGTNDDAGPYQMSSMLLQQIPSSYGNTAMPQDLAEARILCHFAKLLNATTANEKLVVISELMDKAATSQRASWEAYGFMTVAGVGFIEPTDRDRWTTLASLLGSSTVAGFNANSDVAMNAAVKGIASAKSDDGQLALINIYILLRLSTLQTLDENGRAVPYFRGQGAMGGGACFFQISPQPLHQSPTASYAQPTWSISPGLIPESTVITSTAPPLTAKEFDAFLAAFEHLAETHPQWLNDEHIFGLITECGLANTQHRVKEFSRRLLVENPNEAKTTLAVQLLQQRKDVTIAELIDALDRIAERLSTTVANIQQRLNHERNLYLIGNQIVDREDLDANIHLLKVIVNHVAMSFKDKIQTGTFQAAELRDIRNKTIHAMQNDKAKSTIYAWNEGGSKFFWYGLDGYVFMIPDSICAQWREHKWSPGFDEWCELQKCSADAKQALVLEVMQIAAAARRDNEGAFKRHLVRALEMSPDDQELRVWLVAQCRKEKLYKEALALLEQLPEDDSEVLKFRDFEILSVALEAKDQDRAVTAAKRLTAMQLDREERMILAKHLHELNLEDHATQVESRAIRVVQPRKVPTSTDLMEQYRKQGNLDAAAQVAQRVLLRNPRASMSGIQGHWNQRQEPRTEALKILLDSGKLETFIALQTERLARSPNSISLMESLVELYRANADNTSVIAMSQRLIAAQKRSSSAELLQLAEDLKSGERCDEVCDVLSKLLHEHPTAFLNSYSDWADVIQQQHRLKDFVAEMQQMKMELLMEDPEGVCEAAIVLLDAEDSRAIGVTLITRLLQQSPETQLQLLRTLDDPDLWKGKEMFELLMSQLVPSADPATVDMPEWCLSTHDRLNGLFDDEDMFNGVGWLPLLSKTFDMPGLNDVFINRIEKAQKRFLNWHEGELLLAVADHLGQRHQQAHDRIQNVIDDDGYSISDDKALALAVLLRHGDIRTQRDCCRLLEKTLKPDAAGFVNLSKPSVQLLMELYAKTEQEERGRTFLLSQLKLLESENNNVSLDSKSQLKFDAACCLVELDAGLDALEILKSIGVRNVDDDEWYSIDKDDKFSFSEMTNRAADSLTPAKLTKEVLRPTDKALHGNAARIDLRITINIGRRGLANCSSEVLDELEPPRKINDETRAAIHALADTLSQSLDADNADPAVAIVATYWILKSGDDVSTGRITPALDRWLKRPIAEFDPTADTEALLRSTAIDIAFASVARRIADLPGLETLNERMMNRALTMARRLPEKEYLAVLLNDVGTRLKEQGDAVSAQSYFDEMQDLKIPNPEELGMEAVTGRSRGGNRADDGSPVDEPDEEFDLGIELRKVLLN